jgi:hypothetical protein
MLLLTDETAFAEFIFHTYNTYNMAAVPKQLMSLPKVSGIKGIDAKVHTIHPVSATGNTTFAYDQNNVISFMIPAYSRGFFNPQRSFLHYNVTTTDGWMADGCPVVNRMVIKAGNGAVIEDIQGYSTIQRCLSNFDKVCDKFANSSVFGDYSVNRLVNGNLTGGQLKEIYTNNATMQHHLLSGLLGKGQQHYIPVGLFNSSGGFAFEITLYLEDPKVCTVKDEASSIADNVAAGYTLKDVSLQMEIVTMPAQLTDRLDAELFNNSKVSIPFSTYRLHQSYIPANSQSVELQISESAHDLEAVYTCIRKQVTGVYGAEITAKVWDDCLSFLGGHGDRTLTKQDSTYADVAVESYQFRYDTKYFPAKRAEMGSNDNKLALFNALHTLDIASNESYAATMQHDGESVWDKGGAFAIVQSFKTSRDDYLNSLNSSSTGAPLELSISLKKPAAEALRAEHFVKSNYTLNIIKGGQTTLINGAVRNEDSSA